MEARQRTALEAPVVVERITRSPWWLPVVTIAAGVASIALESIRLRLVQIRADLQHIDTAVAKAVELAESMGDATGLALERLEYLLPSLSALTLAFLAATLVLSALTALCPDLPKSVRGGTIAIVLVGVFLLFRNIQ